MPCSINDVILLPIPFSNLTNSKVRPAIVIGHSSRPGDLFVAPISSQLSNVDFVLGEWRRAGLNIPCGVKSQIATIEAGLIVKHLGTLQSEDAAKLNKRLRLWLQL